MKLSVQVRGNSFSGSKQTADTCVLSILHYKLSKMCGLCCLKCTIGLFRFVNVYLYFTQSYIMNLCNSLISYYFLSILSVKRTDKPSEAYVITKFYTQLWTTIRTFAVNNAANNAVNNARAADQGWLPASRLQF